MRVDEVPGDQPSKRQILSPLLHGDLAGEGLGAGVACGADLDLDGAGVPL